MIVEQVLPASGPASVPDVLARLCAAPPARPFDDVRVAFCAELSTALMADPAARLHPELMSLGFFLRRAEVTALARAAADLARPGTVVVPQGLVFHIPPTNVDTIFAYAWVLSLLVGNRNLVRLSRREAPVVEVILGHVARLLGDPRFAEIATGTAIIRYPHDRAISGAISAAADLRVVWGGDATIAAMRDIPLAPHGRDLSFPDRYSLAVIRATAILALDDPALAALADRFYNDVYWFDQAGCSSPRLLVWIGDEDAASRAGDRFFPAIAHAVAQRGYRVEPAHSLAKELYVHRAVLDHAVVGRRRFGGALSVLRSAELGAIPRAHPGAGLLWEAVAGDLGELAEVVTRREQTLVHHGFTADELTALVARIGGRGIDRVVPIGRALAFHRFWDGNDLLAAFTRLVHVEVS